jgi:hypothetical protein
MRPELREVVLGLIIAGPTVSYSAGNRGGTSSSRFCSPRSEVCKSGDINPFKMTNEIRTSV